MDVFPFDKHQGRDIAVAVVVYGGPAVTFDTLTVFQQNIFLNQLFEKNIREFESFISQHTDPRDWYVHFVQHTSIAVPIYISIVRNDKIVYSAPIINAQQMADNIADATKSVRMYLYSKDDKKRFNRFILNECIKGGIISSNHIICYDFHSAVHDDVCFDTLDEHLCHFDLKTGEFINSPHYLWVNALDRLKDANDQKALSFYKLTQIA